MAILKEWRAPSCVKVLAVLLFGTLMCRHVMGDEASQVYTLPFYCSFCGCKNDTNGIITNCSGLGLFRPPKTIDNETKELYLKDNLIKTIKYSNFAGLYNLEILDISGNIVSEIEVGAFRDMSNLKHLYLNGQINTRRIIVLQNIFKVGVFDGLSSLKVLHIHNLLQTSELSYSVIPFYALKVLVALEELRIDGVNNVRFNESFHVLKNLSTVVMSGFDGTCSINQLDRNSFVGLQNLRNLTMSKCRITKLGQGIFWWTLKLQYLDLSWNTELEINQFGTILEELKYTNLQILKINAIHNPDRAGTELLRSDIKYIRDIKLIEIYMDDNGIEFVDYGVFDMFPKSLKKLYLRRNKLAFGYYLYEAVFNNPNLVVLDAGDQAVAARSDRVFTDAFQKVFGLFKRHAPSHVPKFNATSNLYHNNLQPYSEMTRFENDHLLKHMRKARSSDSLPVLNLKTLIYSASLSDLRPLNFSATINNITYMDLSRHFMPMVEALAFDGLYHLEHLNLSHNYMENIHTDTFHGLPSLQLLDLENNLLGYIFKSDKNGKLLSSLVSLRVINLSRNRINSLDKNVFKYTSKIERLDLSYNYIEALSIDLSTFVQLKYIDISYNRLHSIESSVRSDLSRFSRVEMDLSNNHLLCTCDTIPFLKWLFHSDIKFVNTKNYYCSLDGNSVNMYNGSNLSLSKLEEGCKSYHEIIVASSTVGSFIIAILVSYGVYRNRWKLRYLFYMARIKLDKAKVENENDKSFAFDCFISYGDGDRAFVTVDMLQNLEVEGGKRLNIRDRDFEIGEVIAVNISKAIRTSKKTFLMLSRHFLRNKWCNFEMNIARMEAIHMNRAVIVIIFMEEIPTKVLPIELMDLLRDCPNVDLPKDKGLRAAFWQKCVDFINTD
ncbi:toll-like receptor 4 [Ruditapes philippinarum]|uniref:toll-like receptor 4 n=1 Tax=Ruditapes philippinarum TaxID=129788 RepID=UPI00295AE96E|nr:toll-like receptor 4 [Ruditapes philippinarum]